MITFGFYGDYAIHNGREELRTLPPAILDFHNKTLLPFYGTAMLSSRYLDVHGDLNVLRAAHSCRHKHKIRCLNLYTHRKALDFGRLQLSDEDVAIVKELLASVSRLSFSIPSSSSYRYFSPEDQPYQFLKSAINLIHLDIHGNDEPRASMYFALTVGNAYFPHLRSLTVWDIMVESQELIRFVQAHTATLDRLELRDVHIVSQSWYEVFTAIRGRCKELFG